MTKLKMMLFALVISLSAACVPIEDDSDWDLNECVEDCETEQQEQPKLEATFVSGHLGNYMDCPGDGYGGGDVTTEPDMGAAACEYEQDCDDAMLNCEQAQLTVRLTNEGQAAASGLQVTTIELFDADGVSRAVLPLIDAIDTATAEAFDGTVEAGESVTLRVAFQGPEDPYTLLHTSGGTEDAPSGGERSSGGTYGIIEMTLSADNHDDVTIETTELYPVPSVAT